MASALAAAPALSKNAKRRLKKKAEKQLEYLNATNDVATTASSSSGKADAPSSPTAAHEPAVSVDVEYVSSDLGLSEDDPAFDEFSRVFQRFMKAEELCGQVVAAADGDDTNENEGGEDVTTVEEDIEPVKQLGRKERKKAKQLSIAALKQMVVCPDVVEAHDITSADPPFLCYLKAYRNTVPVPRHWCHKRKYLQGKRGIEKIPFVLPDFIANTGIAEVRGAGVEADLNKKGAAKMRDRMAPKLGRIDIDYQVLQDAFFRYQTKPTLTKLGDLYYEGKEFEVKLKTKTPGILSDDLKRALGMVDGVPPPWLLNVQRYGPPPAYPHLKIPGLNAPIPEGASFGYHPGGWGKPPVDENGNPVYGDVFGKGQTQAIVVEEAVSKERWGELEPVVEEEEDDEDEEETKDDDGVMDLDDEEDVRGGRPGPGDSLDLRKQPPMSSEHSVPPPPPPTTSGPAKELYTVLAQTETAVGSSSIYGSTHAYVVSQPTEDGGLHSVQSTSGVNSVSTSGIATDDTEGKRKRKLEKARDEKSSKKYKDFKF
ncbi:hypothetical protein H310_10415 [Aphanomyces invadans]|uniref:PSP proline-rich domain-containing protein n=1 Tax=Aphanomyces invadans TaxID=157072 RepID=A0A024TQE7_9STRA|nr:hypothetical protein H310_10415 [Aphanomyces invadans]ETV96229.1 hypothetical protein H310_10415 [Aphanomyces invadans]|eukprot:XP_008875021.1 hypothetical protein H310_10415 [Aphanomyces invadans]